MRTRRVRARRIGSVIAIAVALGGCGGLLDPGSPGGLLGEPPIIVNDPQARRVLIIENGNDATSIAIGNYYRAARSVPASNVLVVQTTTHDDIEQRDFNHEVLEPLVAKLATLPGIDFIVLTHGIPLRVGDNRYSADALVAGVDYDLEPIQAFTSSEFKRATSPYYQQDEPFSHARFGFYLATRLDGYTIQDMKALVDRSVSARPESGLFFFDQQVYDRVGINDRLETAMENIASTLNSRGFESISEGTPDFIAPTQELMGYWSSGSNDPNYSESVYHALRFKPGSLAETNVSTSARTFHHENFGQSMIADLISQGVTGVKGYVDEPYTVAIAKPDIMFDRYTRGYNLAESFYMASQLLKWKDVVIGDPLCRPYAPGGN